MQRPNPQQSRRSEDSNLRLKAVETLRAAITRGDYPPGSHLGEIQVSEELGISRGTLREALRQLQLEGLVEYGERGRVAVRQISTTDIINTFTVRAALESLAGELIASNSRRTEVAKQLRARIDAMASASLTSLEDHIEADLAFHEELCRLSDNDALLRQWKLLEGPIRMCIMYRGVEKARGNMSAARHLPMVEAIESGDVHRARAEIHNHMMSTAQRLLFGQPTPSLLDQQPSQAQEERVG